MTMASPPPKQHPHHNRTPNAHTSNSNATSPTPTPTSTSKHHHHSNNHSNSNGNNYAAPHTPIASAKRPRDRPSSTNRRSFGASASSGTATATGTGTATHANANANANGSVHASGNGNGGKKLNEISEHSAVHDTSLHHHHLSSNASSPGSASSGAANVNVNVNVMTPVRKMNLDSDSPQPNHHTANPNTNGTSTSATSRRQEVLNRNMSPMHPARPVTAADGKLSTDYGGAGTGTGAGTGAGAGGTTTHAGSAGVLKSIFSPVLHFLNHAKDQEFAAAPPPSSGGVNAGTAGTDTEIIDSSQEEAEAATTSSSSNQTFLRHHGRDPDGDVFMHDTNHANDNDDDPKNTGGGGGRTKTTTTTTTEVAVDKYAVNPGIDSSDHDQDLGQDYGQYTSTYANDPYHHQQQQHHMQHDSDDDVQEANADDDDDEEEFNPYLFIKYLPSYHTVVPNPHHKICLPPKDPDSPPISLVLDLDETLVHCTVEPIPDADMTFPVLFNGMEYKVHVRIRPYLMDFLEAVKDRFEVVVFTASQEVYANELLDRIDPDKKYIKYRMFRESCLLVEGNYLKDLNVLGRDLTQVVLVDNSPHAFGYQINNGIPIESWFDDPNDTELLKLEQFCETLHGVKDVTSMVRSKFQTYKLVRDA